MALLVVACTAPAQVDLKVPAPEDVVMYQVNPRNFAPENSFNAVVSHLDSIKTMGANVLWMAVDRDYFLRGYNSMLDGVKDL